MPKKYSNEIMGIIEQAKNNQKKDNITVNEWFTIFLSNYCHNLKLSTYTSYRQAVNNHINDVTKNIKNNKLH